MQFIIQILSINIYIGAVQYLKFLFTSFIDFQVLFYAIANRNSNIEHFFTESIKLTNIERFSPIL